MTRLASLRHLLMLIFLCFAAPAFAGDAVVYHIDDAQAQGLKGLRNIRNHLDVAPDTKIVVVTHADGVDLLMEGAKDLKNNVEYAPLIAALKASGVTFEVCEITMKRRKLTKNQFVMDADFTPSGVVRLTQLQFRDHYAYIKP
jgi:intracellular sulfur oxidation DsrE/DsrF family protein